MVIQGVDMIKKLLFVLVVACYGPLFLFAQQKYALVIGNGNYSGLSRLANPVNDANDMAAALQAMGFSVDKILDGNLEKMEGAIMRLKSRLSVEQSSYGFMFYAGHGVQSGGENYLIPVDANIPGENFLRNRAVAVQSMLDELNDAGNSLNVVVLDACRDNPFGWGRSGTRGLTIVNRQPVGSIIVYATSAGQQASDGQGRNGLFTSQLLPNLTTPGLEVSEVFKRTGADVSTASGLQQVPAIYNQFFGTAYLGAAPAETAAVARPAPMPMPGTPVKEERSAETSPRLWTVGASVGTSFAAPWVIATARGTIAPIDYALIELGFDAGFISGAADASGYYSLYPFVHVAYYRPFGRIGVYAGGGAGFMKLSYTFPEGEYSENIFAGALTAGVNLFDMVNVSYTFRTNFKSASSKMSVGYTYRFK